MLSIPAVLEGLKDNQLKRCQNAGCRCCLLHKLHHSSDPVYRRNQLLHFITEHQDTFKKGDILFSLGKMLDAETSSRLWLCEDSEHGTEFRRSDCHLFPYLDRILSRTQSSIFEYFDENRAYEPTILPRLQRSVSTFPPAAPPCEVFMVLQLLDIQKGKKIKPPQFTFACQLNHYGLHLNYQLKSILFKSPGQQHYVTIVACSDGSWLKYDDANVRKLQPTTVLGVWNKSVYLMLNYTMFGSPVSDSRSDSGALHERSGGRRTNPIISRSR